jgi:uncharacterized protein YciI
MTDIPTGITVEPTWLIEATYAPDAAESRGPFRARHLARIVELKEAGVIVEAGALGDMSASIVILRAPDEAAALDVVRADIYMANGVWVELRARAFGRVIRSGPESGASGSEPGSSESGASGS